MSNAKFRAACRLYGEPFGLTVADLVSPSRQAVVVRVRHLVMLHCRHVFGWSHPKIGAMLGGRDHTTVLHATRLGPEAVIAGLKKAYTLDALDNSSRTSTSSRSEPAGEHSRRLLAHINKPKRFVPAAELRAEREDAEARSKAAVAAILAGSDPQPVQSKPRAPTVVAPTARRGPIRWDDALRASKDWGHVSQHDKHKNGAFV